MQTKSHPLRRNRLANLLLEASPAAVVLTDSRQDIVLMNRLVEESFGYEEHELLGRSIEQIFPGDDLCGRSSSDEASHRACILSHLAIRILIRHCFCKLTARMDRP
ncbi:MAG: PAS domain S-box protein, partial [Rhodopirellula bahusiensis]